MEGLGQTDRASSTLRRAHQVGSPWDREISAGARERVGATGMDPTRCHPLHEASKPLGLHHHRHACKYRDDTITVGRHGARADFESFPRASGGLVGIPA